VKPAGRGRPGRWLRDAARLDENYEPYYGESEVREEEFPVFDETHHKIKISKPFCMGEVHSDGGKVPGLCECHEVQDHG